jgi:hypothetical protein
MQSRARIVERLLDLYLLIGSLVVDGELAVSRRSSRRTSRGVRKRGKSACLCRCATRIRQ